MLPNSISNSLIDFEIASNLFLCCSLSRAGLLDEDEIIKPSQRHKSPSLDTNLWPYFKSETNLFPSSFLTKPVCLSLLLINFEPLTKFDKG